MVMRPLKDTEIADVEFSHFRGEIKEGADLEEVFLAKLRFRSHWRWCGCGTVAGKEFC